jgi:hypothetical protein
MQASCGWSTAFGLISFAKATGDRQYTSTDGDLVCRDQFEETRSSSGAHRVSGRW